MFRWPSATILRVHIIKEHSKKMCVCVWRISSGSEFITVINSDLGHVRHTQLFIVLFNTVHPEDGHRRPPKHVGVVNKQRI